MKNIFKGLLKRKGQKEEEHGKTTTTAANIKCKECGMQFQSKENLQVHKKKAHSGRGESKKKDCSFVFILIHYKLSFGSIFFLQLFIIRSLAK